MTRDTMRILAQDRLISNNTRTTKLNNNDLIIGPTGAGKTRSYVKPNLLQYALEGGCSLIIADTKGSLVEEVGPVMAAHGYKVINLDFINLMNNSVGYNPLDFVSCDSKQNYSEQEILTVTSALIPVEEKSQPVWEQSAQIFLAAFIGYVLETLPPEEHTLAAAAHLYKNLDRRILDEKEKETGKDEKETGKTVGEVLFQALEEHKPLCGAVRNYQMSASVSPAERTYASIKMFLNKNLASLELPGVRRMYSLENRIDFQALCREKTAVFLTISDTDPSMYKLVNLFYTQALDQLVKIANNSPGYRLPLPVRFILDDFAANVTIPDFDKTIAVIRSREISVSLIIQDINQLYSLYGDHRGRSIINNCDSQLYLGGQDVDTAQFIGTKADRTQNTVLNLPLDDAWLFVRGSAPAQVHKYDLTAHPLYAELPEAGGTPPPLPKWGARVGPGADVPTMVRRVELTHKGIPVEIVLLDPPAISRNRQEAAQMEETPQETTDQALEELLHSLEGAPWEQWDQLPPLALSTHWKKRKALWSRREELSDKSRKLERALCGRDTPVLPWVLDQQGRYSEDAAWTLVGRMCQAIPYSGPLLRVGPFYTAFFYCAVRLCTACPPWKTAFQGMFEDIVEMARQAENVKEGDLIYNELYDSDKLWSCGSFFWEMDELYRLVSGQTIKHTISDMARREADNRRLALEVEDPEAFYYEYQPEFSDPRTIYTPEELEENPELETEFYAQQRAAQEAEKEKAAQEEQARQDWAKTFAAKERFCQQYEVLRRLLFRSRNQDGLAEVTERSVILLLAELKVSSLLDEEAFSRVCAQMDSAAASLKEQGAVNG